MKLSRTEAAMSLIEALLLAGTISLLVFDWQIIPDDVEAYLKAPVPFLIGVLGGFVFARRPLVRVVISSVLVALVAVSLSTLHVFDDNMMRYASLFLRFRPLDRTFWMAVGVVAVFVCCGRFVGSRFSEVRPARHG